ncbi:hypothetical protein sos41_11520 [Alphaproteobacteria bacterium SO-S41]|nr:hypothetical protein sos41_11520 [Alphaproteobacteria bacterium SO-S41]
MHGMANDELAQRLRTARVAAGYADASAAAAALSVKQSSYIQHENGTRGFKRDRAEHYARRFGVSLEWLLTGKGTMKGKARIRSIPLAGHVGAGAQVHIIDGPALEHIDVPYELGSDAEAVEVRGDSMWPAIMEGEILIYDRIRHDPSSLIGCKVIAKLTDGRMFVKLLGKRSKDGLWTLHSFNGAPMDDVDLEWAAEVRIIMKR